jgi:hypothetical protein
MCLVLPHADQLLIKTLAPLSSICKIIGSLDFKLSDSGTLFNKNNVLSTTFSDG